MAPSGELPRAGSGRQQHIRLTAPLGLRQVHAGHGHPQPPPAPEGDNVAATRCAAAMACSRYVSVKDGTRLCNGKWAKGWMSMG